MDSANRPAVQERERSGQHWLTWERLLAAAGWAGAVGFGIVAVVLGDVEAGAVAVGYAATSLLRSRRGRLGAVGIALVSLVTLYFMGAAALTNARIGSPIGWVLVSAAFAAVASVGLLAAVNVLLRRDDASAGGTGPRLLVGVAVIWIVGITTWSLLSNGGEAHDATVSLTAENVSFTTDRLTAPAGEITVEMTNRDLFWHTFTIEELDVDLRVPVGAARTVTFQAEPGIYEFICRIPGHPEAGMDGTFVVADV